ncbi:MAG TPA: DUF2336 domain-containing protein, partial [Aestuariivirga sp.]|nr:DUF2336 domain-containing protein [Aestuariivirga sp.]
AVIDGGDAGARRQLAGQLARLMLDAGAPAVEKEAIVPALLKLAVDPVADIRRLVAAQLVKADDLHADLVFAIIADSDDIALPFLAETRALDHWRMLAIIQVGDEARQVVIAQRHDLSKAVVAHIAGHGSESVCALLLDNAAAQLAADDCRRLYVRFRDRPEIVERLLDRSDLPLEVRILQAKRAANRVHTLMAERGWIPANDAEAIVVDAEETTLLKILESAQVSELDRLIPFLCAKHMLTTSIILRAGLRGRLAIVERALAYLTSNSVQRVRQKIASHGIMGLKSLISASGLPAPSFWLLRAAADIHADLAARHQPLEPEIFARAVVEALMTRYDVIDAAHKMRLLDMVARLTDERTRALAIKLRTALARAA